MAKKKDCNVALIGTKFMGRTHSNAYLKANLEQDPVPLSEANIELPAELDALVAAGLGDRWQSWGAWFITEETWIRTLAAASGETQ